MEERWMACSIQCCNSFSGKSKWWKGQWSHIHPNSITFHYTGSLSMNSDIYCKVTLYSRSCGNKYENHFHIASNDFTWYKVQFKNLSRHCEEQKSGKNTITKYVSWQGWNCSTVHRKVHQTFMESTKKAEESMSLQRLSW